MWFTRFSTSSRRMTEFGVGWRTSTTVAVVQIPVGAVIPPPCGMVCRAAIPPTGSVTLVPLFGPGIASIVITITFPEALLVVVHQGDLGDPLRALPEVQMRDDHPDRTAVLPGQRFVLVRPHHPGLATGDIGQRQVCCITGRR